MREQLLNGEFFYTLQEAKMIIERWRIHDNTVRPHSSLGGQPPPPPACQLRTNMVGSINTLDWSILPGSIAISHRKMGIL